MVTSLDKNTALVLIDLQNGIVNFPVVHPIEGILANAAKLVEAFRKAGLPIVVVNVDPSKSPLNNLRKDVKMNFTEIPDGWLDIAPEIKTETGDIFITKHTWNAFGNPALHEALKVQQVTGIVLAGVSTSIGVEGTARRASELGYNLSFATDAMTDTSLEGHEHSLQRIFPRIGEVDTTENIIAQLS